MTNEEFEKWLKEFHPEVDEVDSVRKELMERGDEMVSFRQLVERFDEVEEEYKGAPWTLKQIYNNFNILIGEKPCEDCISRKEALKMMDWGWKKGIYPSNKIAALPSVTPAEKVRRWIGVDDGMFDYAFCSLCGHDTGETLEYATKYFRYCPNCGAKMQEVEE